MANSYIKTKYQELDKNIWASAFDLAIHNWPLVLLYLFIPIIIYVLGFFQIIIDGSNTLVPIFFIIAMISAAAFNNFFFGKNKKYNIFDLTYILRSAALAIIPLILSLVIAYLGYINKIIPSIDILIVFTAILFIVLSALSFALIGTWLAATITNGNKSIIVALKRGRKTFLYSLLQLTIGPILVYVIALVISILATMFFMKSPNDLSPASLHSSTILIMLVIGLAEIYSIFLGVIIIGRAYIKSEIK